MIDLSNFKLENLPTKILFVSGGPGCGKGTQCEKLVNYYKYNHISVGDLMREELKNNTDEGKELEKYVKSGALVPTEWTINILMKGIKKLGKKKYLIDGFPRNLEQALCFEKMFKPLKQIITFECPEEVLLERLLFRLSKTPENQRRPDDSEEIMKKRIKDFFEITKKSTDFFKLLGNSNDVNAVDTPKNVFLKIKEKLNPKLICFTGFKNSGYEDKAIELANKLSWAYIDFNRLINFNNINNCEEKVEFLKQFLEQCEYKNFVIKGFPETKKQANIFFEHINKPLKLINIEKTKEELISLNPNEENLIEKLNLYFDEKKKLDEYFNNKDFYLNFKTNFNHNNLLKSIGFRLFASNLKYDNKALIDFSNNYNFKILDINEIIESQKLRDKNFEKYLERNNIKAISSILSQCIFSNLDEDKNILLTSIPNCINFHEYFNTSVFNIEFFIEKVNLLNKNIIEFEFDETHSSVISYYYEKNKLIKIHEDDYQLIGNFVEKRANYGFIFGAQGIGKTTISNKLKNIGFEIINFENFTKILKEKLGTEDEPLENVTLEQICHELKIKVKSDNKRYLLDGFNYEINDYNKIMELVGNPSFILRLNASDDTIKNRYIKKNEIGEEIPEEEVEKMNQMISYNKTIHNYIDELMNKDYFLDIIDVNVNSSELETMLNLKKINLKRIIIIRLFNDSSNEENLIKVNCSKLNYIFINLNKIQNLEKLEDVLDNNLVKSKNVVWYENVCSNNENIIYGDNIIFNINNKLGKIRGLFDINMTKTDPKFDEIVEPKIELEEENIEKEAPKEEDDEEKNEEEEDEEKQKKKFDPNDYDWYQINDKFKKLENVFYDLNSKIEVMTYKKNEILENFEETFKNLNKSLDEGEDKYIYYQLYN